MPGGDLQQAFLEKVERHQGIVHKVAAIYAAGREEREDLRQEILLQLWRSFPSFREGARFSTWMYRVALNTALLARRRRRTRPPTTGLEDADPPDTSAAPAGPDAERLQRCIRTLGGLDRAVILLYLEQRAHDEIADLTGISRGAVSVRIVRIKERLRECLLSTGRGRG